MNSSQANRELKRLLNRADLIWKKQSYQNEARVLIAYKTALNEIKNKIASLYEKYGSFSETELRKFNRLTSLHEQLTTQIKDLTGISVNTMSQNFRRAFKDSFTMTGGAIEKATKLNLGFNILPKEALKYAMEDNLWLDSLKIHNAKLLADVKREIETALRTNARQEVISGLSQGKPYGQVAKAIEKRFNVAATRARVIAQTETHKAQSRGRLAGIDRANDSAQRLGIETEKVWKHNDIGKPRIDHLQADGMVADKDGMFNVGGEMMEAPGLGSDPANNIHCHCSAQFQVKGLQ